MISIFEDTILYSVDITSLYTSITHDLGIEAIKYWIRKHRDLIPTRFTDDFIINSLLFVLKNNNFQFNEVYYRQTEGTAMGTNVAPPYAILVIAYLEEYILFRKVLPKAFSYEQCIYIENNYKRYMDDGFIPLLKSIKIETFLECLNSLHPMIKFTEEKSRYQIIDNTNVQILNFLDITVILTENNEVHTDIFYKATNAHDYLNFHSNHPDHVKLNIPYNLAKRIICFVSQPPQMEYRLKELKEFLLNCDYPLKVIEKGIFNAKLQGPAPRPTDEKNTLPLITTNHTNLDFKNLVSRTKNKVPSRQCFRS